MPRRATATTRNATPPRSQKGFRTRERLLAAAKAVFERQGFLGTRISDIAEVVEQITILWGNALDISTESAAEVDGEMYL